MGDRPSSFARSRQAVARQQQPQEQLFDTHPEVSLDFEIVRQAARQKYTRPFLIVDTAIVRGKARRFRAAMPRVRPHYAVKANPDRRVLKVLAQEGVGFEIASTAELDLLLPADHQMRRDRHDRYLRTVGMGNEGLHDSPVTHPVIRRAGGVKMNRCPGPGEIVCPGCRFRGPCRVVRLSGPHRCGAGHRTWGNRPCNT